MRYGLIRAIAQHLGQRIFMCACASHTSPCGRMPRTALLGFGYVPLGPELRDRENRVGAHTVEEVDGLVEARKQVGEYARTDVLSTHASKQVERNHARKDGSRYCLSKLVAWSKLRDLKRASAKMQPTQKATPIASMVSRTRTVTLPPSVPSGHAVHSGGCTDSL